MRIPENWRLKRERYNLIGTECPRCGYKAFPPREICPHCATQTSVEEEANPNHIVGRRPAA